MTDPDRRLRVRSLLLQLMDAVEGDQSQPVQDANRPPTTSSSFCYNTPAALPASYLPTQINSTGFNARSQFRTSVTNQNTSVSSSPSTPISSVISEVRNRFAPYAINDNQRERIAGRSAANRRAILRNQSRTWESRFFCLADPTENKTPTANRRMILTLNGLGESMVSTGWDVTAEELIFSITETFIKLGNHNFELLRAEHGGYGKFLNRVSSIQNVPGVRTLRLARISTIYIRPLESLEIDETLGDENATSILETSPDETENESRAEENFTNVSTDNLRETENGRSLEENVMNLSTDDRAGAVDPIPSTSSVTSNFDNIITMQDYRDELYEKDCNVQHIHIVRDNFFEELFGVYKNPEFNMKMKPKIHFAGEHGADLGALTREYFWKGIACLTQKKVDGKYLFEGQENHFLPTPDSRLLRSGAFKTVGTFMAHSIIHCGIGFIGLSEAVIQYISKQEVDSDTPISICIEDIPDQDVRDAINNMKDVKSGATLTEMQQRNVQETALLSDFIDVIDKNNAAEAIEHILYHQVIEKRKSYLDAIKVAFRKEGLVQLFENKPYLLFGVFPRSNDFDYPTEYVLDRIFSSGETSPIIQYVKHFVQQADAGSLRKLIFAWVGWPVIPDDGLKVCVEADCEFCAHSCFHEIKLPITFNEEDVKINLTTLINNCEGFGLV